MRNKVTTMNTPGELHGGLVMPVLLHTSSRLSIIAAQSGFAIIQTEFSNGLPGYGFLPRGEWASHHVAGLGTPNLRPGNPNIRPGNPNVRPGYPNVRSAAFGTNIHMLIWELQCFLNNTPPDDCKEGSLTSECQETPRRVIILQLSLHVQP